MDCFHEFYLKSVQSFSRKCQIHPESDLETNFIKKETLAQVFSCEFCEISKNNFFTEHLRATAFVLNSIKWPLPIIPLWLTTLKTTGIS